MTEKALAKAPIFLTKSQETALVRLRKIVQMRGSEGIVGGIRPRWNPIIVGASGSGKTAMVRLLVAEFGLPMMAVSVPNWIVVGARTEPQTLIQIRDFVRENPLGGVLFFDELDKEKESFEDAWSASLGAEILMVCDACRRLAVHGWSDQDITFLKRFIIIGAGAWQRVAQRLRKPRTMGFGAETSRESYAELVAQDLGIAEEIAFRFSPDLITLLPPDREDLERGVRMIHRELGVPLTEKSLSGILDRGAGDRTGMRFLESYLADLLMKNPALATVAEDRKADPKSEKRQGGSIERGIKKPEEDPHADRIILTQEAWKEMVKSYERHLVSIVEDLEVWRVKCMALVPSEADISKVDREYFDLLEGIISDMGTLAGYWRGFCAAGKKENRLRNETGGATTSRDLQKKLYDLLHLCTERVVEDGIGEGLARLHAKILWAIQQHFHLATTGKW